MNTPASSQEIYVHLTSGQSTHFLQDTDTARQLLDRLRPDRLFAERLLIIADDDALTVYPSDGIERVDLIMDGLPDWPFRHNFVGIQELLEDDFRRRSHARSGTPPDADNASIFLEIEMVSGRKARLEILLDAPVRTPPSALDLGLLIQQFFAGHGLYARRDGGGAVLLNPANIVGIHVRPGMAEVPPSAWHGRHAPPGQRWQFEPPQRGRSTRG